MELHRHKRDSVFSVLKCQNLNLNKKKKKKLYKMTINIFNWLMGCVCKSTQQAAAETHRQPFSFLCLFDLFC